MGASVRAYITLGNDAVSHRSAAPLATSDDAPSITCRFDSPQQQIIGFGAALTEASAHVFNQMPSNVQEEFLTRCFAKPSLGGSGYTLCRTHLQSSDFALGNYAYVARPLPWRSALSTFSIERDRRLLLPFIARCQQCAQSMSIIAAPWSPPAHMKTNQTMNYGGRLMRPFYKSWANVLSHAVRAWRAEGIALDRLTVQNEPLARQTWDSCLYTARQEATFASRYLRPALDACGCSDVKLLAWDHNKNKMVERVNDLERALERPSLLERLLGDVPQHFDDTFAGTAFHWYAGDHFDNVRAVHQRHPACELIHSEGCAAFSNGSGLTRAKDAEHYAHDIIGDLNAGTNGYVDWNILLDDQGGPNHVGNYCDAPLMYDRATQKLLVNRSFEYLAHFSRSIRPGARIVPCTAPTRLQAVAAVNEDGTRTLTVLNKTGKPRAFAIEDTRPQGQCARKAYDLPAHSICTLMW